MYRFLFLSIFFAAFSTNSLADYYVGSWTSDITPTHQEASESCLGGYGQPYSRCGSTEVLDHITVRSLSISDSDSQLILAVIDTVGVGDSIIDEIKSYVSFFSAGRIKRENIMITATHAHSGPDLQGLWGGIQTGYKNRIIFKTTLSILLSHWFSLPAEAYAYSAKSDVQNRRGWESVDSDINAIDFKIRGTNRQIATLINMSAHPTILDSTNTSYSAGYINALRNDVEEQLGGNCVFINGILGDAEPTIDERTYEASQAFGSKMASKIISKTATMEKVIGDFSFSTLEFEQNVSNPGIIAAIQAGLLDVQLDDNLNVYTQFGYMSFGNDLGAILFPGEALTRLGLPIKDAMNEKHKLFFGLAGDSLGYFIPSDEFLQIENRTTEEQASLDPFVGDRIKTSILEHIGIE